jgi:hypothetical protein
MLNDALGRQSRRRGGVAANVNLNKAVVDLPA